jgi:glycerophosphoryl diester phosphodiesterase
MSTGGPPQGARPPGGAAGSAVRGDHTPALPAWPYPRLCAHRGAGKLAPENTLTAMRVGHAHGYGMVEFDVKLAADNVAFLLHDSTLERTTSGRGRADALLWRDLSRLDAGGWHSAKYAGEMLPTFAAVARWARAHGVACNVEIKPTPGRERETGAAVALDAASLWRDAEVPPLLSSFAEASLVAARDAVPGLPRALLVDELPSDWLDRLASLGCVALDADHKLLTREIVASAHRHGFRVCCWTPNDAARVKELAGFGIDTIITDAIDVIPANSLD